MIRGFAIVALSATLSATLGAQVLLKDLDPRPPTGAYGYGRYPVEVAGSRAVMIADDGVHGTELWVIDMRTQTARMLAERRPGAAGQLFFPWSDGNVFFGFVPHQGRAFFRWDDGAHGQELWVTDGTESGTHMVLDIRPGAEGSAPAHIVAFGDRVWFDADDGIYGRELWSSDGSAAGTRLAFDWTPGAAGSRLRPFAATTSRLYCHWEYDPSGDTALVATDGTASGTVVIQRWPNIPLPPPWSAALGSRLLFWGMDAATGGELWSTDGSAAGTKLVADINPGPLSGVRGPYLTSPAVMQGRVYFVGDDGVHGRQLWSSDGTSSGTNMVADLGFPQPYDMWGICATSSRVFFAKHDSSGWENLCCSDGTAAGTRRVADLAMRGKFVSWPDAMLPFGDRVVFVIGSETWISDGTEAGTMPLGVRSGSRGDPLAVWCAAGGKLLVTGVAKLQDSVPLTWISDGTPSGTNALQIARATAFDSRPRSLVRLADSVLFTALDRLHVTDGTALGTRPFSAVPEYWYVGALGQQLLLARSTNNRPSLELWVGDGSAAGTSRLGAFDAILRCVRLGNRAFLLVHNAASQSLWSTDGTLAGSRYEGVADPDQLTAVGDTLFFTATKTGNTRAIYATDVEMQATRLVFDDPAVGVRYYPFAALDTLLCFFGAHASFGPQMYSSDGTPGGLRYLGPLEPLEHQDEVAPRAKAVRYGGSLWFGARQPGGAFVLCRTDGKSATIVGLPELPLDLTVAGGRLWISGHDRAHGRELWVLDSPQSYPRRVADLVPGELGSDPHDLRPAGMADRIVFAAATLEHGDEAWTSDGTAAGTRRLSDLMPGTGSSAPSEFTRIGSKIVFAAADPFVGRELFALDVADTGAWVAEAYGAGCTDRAPAPPRVGYEAAPTLGSQAFAARVDGALGSRPAAALVGAFGDAQALGNGCTLHVGGPLLAFPTTTTATGSARLPLSVPADPSALGRELHVQWVIGDLGTFSDALLVVVGER